MKNLKVKDLDMDKYKGKFIYNPVSNEMYYVCRLQFLNSHIRLWYKKIFKEEYIDRLFYVSPNDLISALKKEDLILLD
jgi:hypothetical protein